MVQRKTRKSKKDSIKICGGDWDTKKTGQGLEGAVREEEGETDKMV